MKKITERVESLQNCVRIQCWNGNWNWDPYMLGMANGMLLALAIIKNENYVPLRAPKKWLSEKKAGPLKTVKSR